MTVATHKLALLLVVVLVAVVASSSESTFDESTSQAVSEQQEPQQMFIQSRSLLGKVIKVVKIKPKKAYVGFHYGSQDKGVIAKGIAIAGRKAGAYVSAASPKFAVAKAVAVTKKGGTAKAHASASSSKFAHASSVAISG